MIAAAVNWSSLLQGYSTSDIVYSLLFAVVFAVLGYRISYRYRLVRGVTPWRLPSAVWALICFFVPFGIVLELVAQFTTKSAGQPGPGQSAAPSFPAYPQSHESSGQSQTYPIASAPTAIVPSAPEAILPIGPPPPIGDGSGKTPLFGWYLDVTGRNEQRYWDGREWTELVRNHGVDGSDPVLASDRTPPSGFGGYSPPAHRGSFTEPDLAD
jgi:hypothetical protein